MGDPSVTGANTMAIFTVSFDRYSSLTLFGVMQQEV